MRSFSTFKTTILCVQEVVTPIYIMSYYINRGNYFLDTRYKHYKNTTKMLN